MRINLTLYLYYCVCFLYTDIPIAICYKFLIKTIYQYSVRLLNAVSVKYKCT